MIAAASIAPFRLGLTATPERADGQDAVLPVLLGPIVYRREITQLAGEFLADYRTERVYVDLTPEEEQIYRSNRDTYRAFVTKCGFSLGGQNGWQRFIFECTKSAEGRAAFRLFGVKLVERAPVQDGQAENSPKHRGDWLISPPTTRPSTASLLVP